MCVLMPGSLARLRRATVRSHGRNRRLTRRWRRAFKTVATPISASRRARRHRAAAAQAAQALTSLTDRALVLRWSIRLGDVDRLCGECPRGQWRQRLPLHHRRDIGQQRNRPLQHLRRNWGGHHRRLLRLGLRRRGRHGTGRHPLRSDRRAACYMRVVGFRHITGLVHAPNQLRINRGIRREGVVGLADDCGGIRRRHCRSLPELLIQRTRPATSRDRSQ